MVKINTRYQCEVCGHEWRFQKLAEFCENYQLPPSTIKAGDEVKLKNRNVGYTLAVVKNIALVHSRFVFEPKDEDHLEKAMSYFETAPYHRTVLWLDREVELDHKWDGKTSCIDPLYVLTEEEAAGMPRDDNNAW